MKRSSPVLRTALSTERGVAMVEAVIVLPVFIILFVGVFYVRDLAVATQALDNEARSCAWRYSKNGCTAVPDGCEVHEEKVTHAPDESITHALQGVETSVSGSGDAQTAIYKMAGKILGPAVEAAFGRSAVATPSVEVARPRLLGGKKALLSAKYQLTCNLLPKEPLDVAKDAWNLVRGKN